MKPIRVGIREAKIHLSRLLEDVQNGRNIIITNHGKPVGKIIPIPKDSLSLEERVSELERQGWIEPRKTKKESHLPSPLPLPDELAQRYLQEDRNS